MLRVEKVATPTTAATCVVPARVPPPGLVPMLTVTLPVKPVRVLPKTSWAVTRHGGHGRGARQRAPVRVRPDRDRDAARERGGGVAERIAGRDLDRRGERCAGHDGRRWDREH